MKSAEGHGAHPCIGTYVLVRDILSDNEGVYICLRDINQQAVDNTSSWRIGHVSQDTGQVAQSQRLRTKTGGSHLLVDRSRQQRLQLASAHVRKCLVLERINIRHEHLTLEPRSRTVAPTNRPERSKL